MTEVAYRTVLMDRTDLRTALASMERSLNDLRDAMIDRRDLDYRLVGFAAEVEIIAADARAALALTEGEYP